MPQRTWLESELRFLNKSYNRLGPSEIARILSRSPGSVRGKARDIGLQQASICRFSQEQIEVIKEHYELRGATWVANEIGRTPAAVMSKANEMGIRSKYYKTCMANKKGPIARGSVRSKEIRSNISKGHKKRWQQVAHHSKGRTLSQDEINRTRDSRKRNAELRLKQGMMDIGKFLASNAKRLAVQIEQRSQIVGQNEDVMLSQDGEWLLSELQKSFDISVQHIVRMSAIVRRLDELGVAIELESSVLPYLRKIAHGNLSPDLFVTMQGNKCMLNIASTLPSPLQASIAKNEPVKVMELNGDHRLIRPLDMTTKQVSQVFAFGRIRSDAEQVGHLRERLQLKEASKAGDSNEAVRIDRKRKGIIVGQTFIPLVVLQQHVAELTKRKARATA